VPGEKSTDDFKTDSNLPLKRFTGLNNKEIGDIFKMEYHAISKVALNIERLIKGKSWSKAGG